MKTGNRQYYDSCVIAIRNAMLKKISQGNGKGIALDVGCGSGDYTELLTSGYQFIVATDIINSFDRSRISQQLSFIRADGFRLPFKDDTFDLVISMDVLEHIGNDALFLEEMRRVLKDRGIILAGTPNLERFSNKLKAVFGSSVSFPYLVGKDERGDCVHLREYTKDSLGQLFAKAGFKQLSVEQVWFGLRHKFIKGIEKPPLFLNRYCQYLLLKAFK